MLPTGENQFSIFIFNLYLAGLSRYVFEASTEILLHFFFTEFI